MRSGIELYGLRSSDLKRLRGAARFDPVSVARPLARRRAEMEMRFVTSGIKGFGATAQSPVTVRETSAAWLQGSVKEVKLDASRTLLDRRRALVFWSDAIDLLQKSGASSAAVSDARTAWMRARRRSSHGRERVLLSLYSTVGYGERVSFPFLLHVGVSATAAAYLGSHRAFDLASRWALFWRILASPLSLLRDDEFRLAEILGCKPQACSGTTLVLPVVVRGLGVLMIALSILAVRRVVGKRSDKSD